ncbi:protein disabled-like isoform X2 [Homarus americanus]|uniref:protein disabled-like isoform X2 n=1 Tax=Homarus americanus TaxID=6706 RepID=UPI001C48A03D|nr:protein disabled-like isoform X2 [Homarus americanus]
MVVLGSVCVGVIGTLCHPAPHPVDGEGHASSWHNSCGADVGGRGGGGGGGGGVEHQEGAPPLPTRPPPTQSPRLSSPDTPVKEGWARLSWVAPRTTTTPHQQQPKSVLHPDHPHHHLLHQLAKKSLSQPQLQLLQLHLQQPQPESQLQQQPQPQQKRHLRLHRSLTNVAKRHLQNRHHDHGHNEGATEAVVASETLLLKTSSSGSNSSLNSRASSSSGGTGPSFTTATSTNTVTDMSGSGTSGASASYNTIRRGLKATTSKLMGATSVRKPHPSPSTSSDRQGGPEKNDPHRFVEGMSFKGKLIGVLEVSEARGDRMCQEALAELKMAVRAAGEHKQRIVINVAMDGIRLRDERSSDCLYHHPVHKISFIAQDMTDTRAFGYIFGSPDAGHKFFGIKTEKAASQVVIAMRDLFQAVFEMKKKEIEKARSQLEEGRDRGEFRDPSFGGLFGSNGDSGIVSASLTSGAGGAIADLLDLQSELSSLQKGLTEISQQRAQQNQKEGEQFDPFGDSFKPTFPPPDTSKPRITASTAPTPAPLAPPPVSGRTRHDSHHGSQQQQTSASGGSEQKGSQEFGKFPVTFPDVSKSPPPAQNEPAKQVSKAGESQEDRYAAFKEFRTVNNGSFNDFSDARFCEGQESQASGASSLHQADDFDAQWIQADFPDAALPGSKETQYDVFTDLDPLGTGKNRPYVDKRDFFSDMRKPVRRVLRELGDGEASAPCSPRTQPGMIPPEVSALVASTSLYATTPRSICVTASRHSASTNITPVHCTSMPSHSFTESFSPPDSFGQEDFRFHQASEKDFYEASNFSSSGFADFNTFPNDSPRSQRSEMSSSIPDEPPPPLPCGPLTVALPPESFRDSPPPFSPPPVPRSPARMASGPGSPQLPHPHHSPVPQTRLSKQIMVATSSLSPKTLPRSHKFRKQSSFESEWDMGDMGHSRGFTSGELTPPTPPQLQSEGGLSPRPRPRSYLSKQLSASSATLSLRPSHSRFSDVEQFSSPEVESRPFPTDELNLSYEEAPKPPPRPAHIEPPPLPPKRQPTHVSLRPPPRPPPTSDAHYNYINEYDSSPEEANTPPIPIPARKPRYPDSASQPAFIPSRCTKPSHPDNFQFPKPSVSPTHELTGAVPKSSRESTPSKLSTPGKSPKLIPKSNVSVDLANTSLDQLAASLDMPVEQLARMTVVELAACLAQLQLRQGGDLEDQAKGDIQTHGVPPEKPGRRSKGPSRDQSKERFAFSEDEMFAEFDAQFPKSPVEPPEFSESSDQHVTHAVGAPVSEDRYAVFRELTTVTKQKSVFDENFLTPQNSMEEEVSEVSSGTFKANFDGDLRHDSLEHKSSLSDDGDAAELEKDKEWHPPNHDLECVTVFRSPEISEYDNFEPAFDAKFDDDFSAATMSEKSLTPVNSPSHQTQPSPRPHRQQIDTQKSPFTDDFSASCHTGGSSSRQTSGRRTRPESETSFASFDDNFVPSSSDVEKYSNFQDLSSSEQISRQNSLRSPFTDNFVDSKRMEQVDDSGFASSFGDNTDKFDDPFTTVESKPRSSSRSSIDNVTKTPIDRENSLQPPADTSTCKRKSPFDDDFTNRGDRYEVLKEVESEREPSLEGEVSRLTRQGDPRASPFDDSWHGSHRNTPYDDQKSIGSLHSIHEENRNISHESPFDDDFNQDSRKASVDHGRLSRSGSENRKSPFGDSFTPPTSTRPHRNRVPSRLSVGSEGSDVRHSPFEDNFSSIIGSVAEEVNFDTAFPSLPQDSPTTSEAAESDPFSVKLSKVQVKAEGSESEMQFADFENAFQQNDNEEGSEQSTQNQTDGTPGRTPVPSEDAVLDDVFPSEEAEFKITARYVAPTADMKKSDSVSIFRRNSDPFADDFFSAENEINITAPSGKTDADPFWEEPFDNFSFPKEQ